MTTERQQCGLWYGDTLLTEVLVPPGASDDAVRYEAIRWHDRVPLCFPERTPWEHRGMLCRATVRRYLIIPGSVDACGAEVTA